MLPIGTAAAIIAITLWTIASTISKKISRGLGANLVTFLYLAVSIVPIAIGTVAIGTYSISTAGALLAALAGLFLSLGFISTFKALTTEHLSSVIAVSEIYPVVFVLFGILVLGQTINEIQLVSMVVIFAGAAMIITTEKLRLNKMMIPAVVGAVSWTIYWIIMTYSIHSAGTFALPILISRVVGIPFAIIFLLINRNAVSELKLLGKKIKASRMVMVMVALTIIASFSDAVGDTVFGITIGSSVLVIGAALVALQPMVVSFFGFLFYKEKLTKVQFLGLATMFAGAFVLSVL